MRCAMGVLGVPLMLNAVAENPHGLRTVLFFNMACFIQLPLFFSWMYAFNGHNDVWLASAAAVIVVYFHLTDWRIAAVGTLIGFLLGTLLGGEGEPLPPQGLVIFVFFWVAGLMLGLSGANLRRERLNHSLTTIGIMAHELRTPLSTVSLIGDALRMEAKRQVQTGGMERLERLGQRLQTLTRLMNHHIDLQIANARLMQPPRSTERIAAHELVLDAVRAYPYRTSRERDCIEVVAAKDFFFHGSRTQFLGVFDNLLQNALRSLQAASSRFDPGDLRIEIDRRRNEGRIVITDRGTGIDSATRQRVFEPFFSTHLGTGHGLGLTFCRQVVASAGGDIRVSSEPGKHATFTITLPILEGRFLPLPDTP